MPHRTRWTSRVFLIFAAISSIFAGGALLSVPLVLLVLGKPFAAPATAGLTAACGLGFVVLTVGACRLVRRLAMQSMGDDDDGGGRGGPGGPDPMGPQPPFDEPDWWPEFERELRAYLEAHERVTVAG